MPRGPSLRLLTTLTAWRLAYPRPNPKEGARQGPQRKPRKSHATSSAISYWLHESIQLSMEQTTHRQEHQEAGIAEPTLEAGYHRRHPTAEATRAQRGQVTFLKSQSKLSTRYLNLALSDSKSCFFFLSLYYTFSLSSLKLKVEDIYLHRETLK